MNRIKIYGFLIGIGTSIFFSSSSRAIDASLAPLTGMMATIFWHETGHATLVKASGYRLISFQPYPWFCGENFRPGCVIHGGRESKGIFPFFSNKTTSILISTMGTGFSIIGALVAAPRLPHIDNEHNRKMLETMVELQSVEWPFYVLSDLMGYGGDWQSVAKTTKIPLILFLPISIATTMALINYTKPYRERAREKYEPEEFGEGSQSTRNFKRLNAPIVGVKFRW